MSARRWAGTSQHVRMATASTASGTRCWPSSSTVSRSGSGSAATESRELDAGSRVVGRLHVTLKRLPPHPPVEGGGAPSFQRRPPHPPVEGGGAASFQRRPPHPPVEGGGAASFQRRPGATAACVNRDRVPVAVRSQAYSRPAPAQVPVVVLVPLAPVDGDGAWASPCREGQPGQLRSSAARLCGTVSSPAANRSALSVAPTSELSRTPKEGSKPPDPLTEAVPCPGAQGAPGALGPVGACAGPWGTAIGSSIMSRPAPASAAAAATALRLPNQ